MKYRIVTACFLLMTMMSVVLRAKTATPERKSVAMAHMPVVTIKLLPSSCPVTIPFGMMMLQVNRPFNWQVFDLCALRGCGISAVAGIFGGPAVFAGGCTLSYLGCAADQINWANVFTGGPTRGPSPRLVLPE